jgi:hypothetical protein
MSDNIKPLERDPPILSKTDSYGIYVQVPHRQKDSIVYRNMVKYMGGKYDPLRERWTIESTKLDADNINIINHYKIYDGKFFKYMRNVDDVIFDSNIKVNHLRIMRDKPIVCKEMRYSKEHTVHFYAGIGSEFVIQAFYTNLSNFLDVNRMVNEGLIYINILPTEIARDEYRHYSARSKHGVVTLDPKFLEVSYNFWCDRFANMRNRA